VTGHSRDTPGQTPNATNTATSLHHILYQGNMRCMQTGRSSRRHIDQRRLLRLAKPLCLSLLMVGCTRSGNPPPTSGSTPTSLNSANCAQGAIAAATTYLRAVAAGDSAIIRRCDHLSEPLAPWLLEHLSSSPWLYEKAAEIDLGQAISRPDQVAVAIPLPDDPRGQMAPHGSGVIITTTLYASGAYYVTAVVLTTSS
jgi:hypothetical protein